MQLHLYTTNLAKITFIISLLTGRALQWAETIWTQAGTVTQSLIDFIVHFHKVFGKPVGVLSVGQQLYHLHQGKMSINDYALKFRTLATTASGRNEISLLTPYRQGLVSRVWLHLAAYNDFISSLIICSRVSQSTTVNHLTIFLHQPETLSTPEPGHDPMQVDSTRLSYTERQRRLTQGLCLYCVAGGHIISVCPIRPPRPMVSVLCTPIAHLRPLTTTVILTASDVSLPVDALLVSGSAGNFISRSFCRQLHLPMSAT